MDSLEACKICLVQGVRMFSTQGCMDNYLKELLGHKKRGTCPAWMTNRSIFLQILYSADLPPFVCYECASLLEKCIKFKEKCLHGQNVLFEILANKNEITEEGLLSINRIKMNLVSNLMYYPIPEENIYEFEHEESDLEEVEVKEEFLDFDDVAAEEDNPLIKEEDIESSPKKRILSDVEDDNDDRFVDDPEDSDYEPSTFHATTLRPKPKPTVVKPKKKKKKKASNDVQTHQLHKNDSWETGLNIKKYPGSKEEDMLEKDFIIKKLTTEEQIRDVMRRKESSNYKDSPFKCDFCYRGYLQEETLQNHMVHHAVGSGQYECKICILNLKCKLNFIEHMMRHERRYECKQCAFIAEDFDQAKKHRMWHYGVTYKCQYCDEVSNELSTHLSHMRAQHPSHFICDLCGYSFVSAAGLKMHRSRMHREGGAGAQDANTSQGSADTQDGGLYCKECDLHFDSEETLNQHKETSEKHKSESYNDACRHCGSVFPTAELLRSHQRLHALNLAVRRMLSSKKIDARHRTGKFGEGKYPAQCELCEETLQSRSLHWKHYQRVHQKLGNPHAQKKFVCECCGKGFPSNTFLSYHARTHTDERAFKCSTCDKSFHTKSNLTAHLKTHEQDRQTTCEVCCKQFKSAKGLQEHTKLHTNERAHPCLYCDKAFPRPQGLALHIKKTHMMMAPPGQGQNGT